MLTHIGSKLLLENNVEAIDKNTVALFNYNGHALSHKELAPNSGSIYTQRYDGKFNGAIAIEKGTTNLIPGGATNSYPSYGNTHGTYNTNQYNNGSYFSIGTITSVTDNIVTYVPGTSLRTYDVVTPQTTGGGVTAGTRYFVKAISTTQFTLHAYNSLQDGSLGFAVHDTIKNDIRIPINATSFPTMWIGPAHLPHSGLVKEIIPNGFSSGGKIHDCLRMYTNFRSDGVSDYLAYSVTPSITLNTNYTVSFYYRAVTPETIGRTSSFQMHNGVGFGFGSFTFAAEWKRYEAIVSSTMTGNASMYWNAGYGVVWEISEIQVEQLDFATSFTTGARAAGKCYYPKELINLNSFTISCWFNIPKMYTTEAGNAGIQTNWYHPIIELCPTSNRGDTGYSICAGPNAAPFNRKMILRYPGNTQPSDAMVIQDNTWYHLAGTFDGSTYKIYINGELDIAYSSSTPPVVYDDTVLMVGGGYFGAPYILIDELRIDNISRTNDEILGWYLSNAPFYSQKEIFTL